MTLTIIPRTTWGARHDDGFADAPLPAAECWAHHSVSGTHLTAASALADDIAAVRALEEIGESRFGGGISYTWLLTPAGRVFQGHSPHRRGAHTAGRNDRARAVCFIGNYETSTPTPQQLRAAAWLLQHAHTRGWLRRARLDGGHRDVSATACPGTHVYAAIGHINQTAAGPPIREDNAMQLTDTLPAWDNDETGNTTVTVQDLLYGTHYHAKHADQRAARIEAKLDALTGTLADDEATILAAIRGLQHGHVDVHALAAALVPLLPPETTPEQIADAVANEQARRLAG